MDGVCCVELRDNLINQPHNRSPLRRQLILALLATLVVAFVAFKYPEQLHITIVIASFVIYVVETILQYKAGRSIVLSLQRAIFPLMVIAVLSLVIVGGTLLLTMKH